LSVAAIPLQEVIGDLDVVEVPASSGSIEISGVSDDSRTVCTGDLFVAVQGEASDGHDYVAAAAAAGAVAVVAERRVPAEVPVLVAQDLKRQRSAVADLVYGQPSAALTCVGVTGTNGKTSVACYIAELAVKLGKAAGYMGTIGWGEPGALSSASLTTESAIMVQARLAEFRDRGLDWAVLEVSSHALDQHRVDAVRFNYAVFTNLSRDHLDYHGDFQSYGRAKARLFRFPELAAAVINLDDEFGRQLAAELDGALEVLTYGASDAADVHWSDLQFHLGGVRGRLHSPWGQARFELPLYGDFSVANATAAVAVLCHAGWSLAEVVAVLADLTPVPGRVELFPGAPTLVVDYAHTPDALAKMLAALKPHLRPGGAQGSGKLICLCGCGGDRDRGKRPLMAAAACANADEVWFTSDNPRTEDPAAIIEDMLRGVPEAYDVRVCVDRREAIEAAVRSAGPADLVVIAGKGHEDYQEVNGQKLPFDDRAIARALTEGL
jgi:UDP-N-acetylmuramoyl-L-alanyl-D-glutamate--2,6-diaminopimelate ligase